MSKGGRASVVMVGVLAFGVLLAGPARANPGGDPPGNNGTIKIDGKPFDDAPDNEPHPGCVFQVDFYGFDAGDLDATLTFEAVAPTPGGVLLTDTVPIGEDSHAGGGSESGLDASKTYDLSSELAGIEPQQNQGWHVRLTVNADGSQGSDVKHKVFWVDDCAGTAPTTPSSGDTGGGSSSAPSTTAPSEAPAAPETAPASVLGIEMAAPVSPDVTAAGAAPAAAAPSTPNASALPAEVLGESISRTPSGAVAASSLARTGMGLGLAIVALALVAVGLVFQRVGALRLPHRRQ